MLNEQHCRSFVDSTITFGEGEEEEVEDEKAGEGKDTEGKK
jgi:hypothetical protein